MPQSLDSRTENNAGLADNASKGYYQMDNKL